MMKHAEETKDFPAVGCYKNLDNAYIHHVVIKKERSPVIFPYKNKGFADDEIKRAKATPGPGAYHIGPPVKNH
jgi:hypothetical protein